METFCWYLGAAVLAAGLSALALLCLDGDLSRWLTRRIAPTELPPATVYACALGLAASAGLSLVGGTDIRLVLPQIAAVWVLTTAALPPRPETPAPPALDDRLAWEGER